MIARQKCHAINRGIRRVFPKNNRVINLIVLIIVFLVNRLPAVANGGQTAFLVDDGHPIYTNRLITL